MGFVDLESLAPLKILYLCGSQLHVPLLCPCSSFSFITHRHQLNWGMEPASQRLLRR
jgi:hypothetical protein